MLAMAHGSNEINVSAPLAAQLFLLNGQTTEVNNGEIFFAISIGLISLLVGTMTIGRRYLHNYRKRFMSISLSNGCIANTMASIVLLGASYANFTVSCTYILSSSLLLIRKKDKGAKINKYKVAKAIVFALLIIILSATASVITSYLLLMLDYHGPNSEINDAWY
jgi:phosphate/sulfate permease